MTEEKRDDSKAEQFLKQYLTGSDDELGIGEYALGKLYLSQDRIEEAEQLFISSSEKEERKTDVYVKSVSIPEEQSGHRIKKKTRPAQSGSFLKLGDMAVHLRTGILLSSLPPGFLLSSSYTSSRTTSG